MAGVTTAGAPLYQVKAELFKALGHPVRVRVLELLSEREQAVSELLAEVGIEASHLSQQLGVLRRAGLVRARKQGSAVFYSLSNPGTAELLAVARQVLAETLKGQMGILDELKAADTTARQDLPHH